MQNNKLSHLGISSLKSKGRRLQNNAGFSFVELIVVLAILALLAIIGVNMYNSVDDKTNNSKVITGAKTLKSAFTNYLQVEKELPNPSGNKNYFKVDSSYAHHDDSDIFGVYGSVTEKTLPKKYLDNLPLDPVSNHYYSYGKTINNDFFEIASVLRNNGESRTKLEGTYPGENGPISLIREYNGPQFLQDKSSQHLPYNPDEHTLTAKLISKGNDVKVNNISVGSGSTKLLRTGDTIELDSNNYAQIYFADGSVSLLGDDSESTKLTLSDLDFKEQKDNLLTKVRLYLSVGSIFTQATALNDNSDFEIYTSDTTAAVRGTEFLVKKDPSGDTSVEVIKGQVDVYPTPIESIDVENYMSGDASGVVNKIKDFEIKDTTKLDSVENKKQVKVRKDATTSVAQPVSDITESEVQAIEIKVEQFLPILNSNIPEGKTVAEIKMKFIKDSLFKDTLGKDWKLYAAIGYDYPGDLELKNQDYRTIGKVESNGIQRICEHRYVNNGYGQCNLFKWPSGIFPSLNPSTFFQNKFFSFSVSDLLFNKAHARGFWGRIYCYVFGCSGDSNSQSASSVSSTTESGATATGTGEKIEEGKGIVLDQNVVFIDSSFIALNNGVTGIFIDNQNNSESNFIEKDYIKYSDLELGDNFAIEMRVRGADLLRSEHDTNYFLLKLSNGFKLQLNNGNLELYNPNNCATLSGSTINTFINSNNNKFYKVILSNEKLVIADDSGKTIEKKINQEKCSNMSNINEIILGADYDTPVKYKNQWNGIIDYLKIYKKED